MYDGPLYGIPVEASRGFLKGWYAEWRYIKNPRLGFVCVSEDPTANLGFVVILKNTESSQTTNDLYFHRRTATKF